MQKDMRLFTDKSKLAFENKLNRQSSELSLVAKFIVTFVYFSLAIFSTQFDIPDHYNLLAGLPAGLALVIFVVWGSRLYPYIWLAKFAAEILFYTGDKFSEEFSDTVLLTAFLTATGTVIQALIGSYLVQPLVKQFASPASIVDTIHFLILAGPFSCLVSTTIKTATLYQFHDLPSIDIFSTWFTGYVYDTLAVLLLAPTMLARHYLRIGKGWHRRIITTTASLFCAAVLLLSGLYLLNQKEAQNARLTFENFASNLVYQIRNTIYHGEDRLRSISGLITSSSTVTPSEFHIFNQSFELPPGIISLSWAPRGAEDGLTSKYYHQLVYPKASETSLYGVNLAEQVASIAVFSAAETGKRAIAPSLVYSDSQDWWMIFPVYTRNFLESRAKPNDALLGFAVAQMKIQTLFASLADKANQYGIALRINGVATWHSSTPLLAHNVPSQITPDFLYHMDEDFAGAGLQLEMWNLTALPFESTSGTIIFLLFSMLVMMLASIYALNLLSHGLYLQQQVEQKTTEISIKNAETSALVEHLKDVAITINKDGLIHSVNPAAERVFGYTTAEMVGSKISVIIPELVCNKDNCCFRVAPRILDIEHEAQARQKSGDLFPVQLMLSEYSIAGHRYFSGILRDLREQKRSINALETALNKAKAANQAKSEFLAAMSHEIRTPMNGVIGMLDVLAQSDPRADQMEMVELIRDSAHALLGIINDILDFSKIEAGKLQLTQEPISIESVTEKVCTLLDCMAEQAKVELTLFVDPTIPSTAEGDTLRVSQILYNLINNAIKFSSKQSWPGKVTVRVKLSSLEENQAWVDFIVQDNGIGMDEMAQSRLFEPFEQGESSTTKRFGGTGLGMTISHALVTKMGGEITLQSKPNKGSTFIVRLPFALLPGTKKIENISLAGIPCLVISAESDFATDIACYLTHAGATVQHTLNIDTASVYDAVPSQNLWIWLLNTDIKQSLDSLRMTANQHLQKDIRLVILSRGRRRVPRQVEEKTFMIDANVLTRRTFLHTVEIAANLVKFEELPGQYGAVRFTAETPPTEKTNSPSKPILVAEDNEINQKVIFRQLALLGVMAEVVENGQKALERWRDGDYALLLTDVHMPTMDGYELTAAIRTEEAQSNRSYIPIIALTANAMQGEADRCKALGMDDYLSKPVQLAVLKKLLHEWKILA